MNSVDRVGVGCATPWPARLKPKPDELLSSWLVRLAIAHGQKLHTFCSLGLPGKAIWNRDIDKCADDEIVRVLAAKTGTPVERAGETRLASYEGTLYERHNTYGPSTWIMPVGVYHRTRRRFGLQYCARCLSEDVTPYYRRRWRLAFMTVCDVHRTPLRDRCPRCESPVAFHRNELGDFHKFSATSLTLCHGCGFDLRREPEAGAPASATTDELSFAAALLRAVADGYMQVTPKLRVRSLLFFAVLRQLMKVLAMRDRRVAALRRELCEAHGIDSFEPGVVSCRTDVPEFGCGDRRRLLGSARCLLADWPDRFVRLSRRHKLWSSIWLRHLEPDETERAPRLAPFWFWSVVQDQLYRAPYRPSAEEVERATAYLLRQRSVLNKSELARLLGVAVVRMVNDPARRRSVLFVFLLHTAALSHI